ncbi:hypothetical protein EsH8_V_000922 [Colletotrichum jinshuiense]
MFPFDVSALPQLPTRKGLLVIDFQNDFLSADGALPVAEPDALVTQTLDLVKAFRKVGDVIWVCTEFDKFRTASSEQIWATDALPKPKILESRARRRTAAPSDTQPEAGVDADPEAFLSQPGPKVVRSATPGADFPTAVKEALGPRDTTFIKSHYSAFASGQLLQTLRVKFVHELYLCGSLANIGVYATAMDAAKFGYAITLVENCCGFRSDLRLGNAVQSLVDVTGCEVEDSDVVIEALQPKPAAASPSSASSPVVPKRIAEPGGIKTPPAGDAFKTNLLEEQLAKLSLGGPGAAKSVPSSSRPRPPTGGHECVSFCDALEVDPGAQPPQPTKRSDSPDNKAPRNTPGKMRLSEMAARLNATAAAEDATPKEPLIPKPAPGDDDSSASEAELQPESKPVPDTKPADKQAAMDGEIDVKESTPQATEPLCEGDTTVFHNILPGPLAEGIFEKVRDEVLWQRMSHQGGEVPRLVAVQGEVADDGSMPVYRHPSDESPPLLPFSPTILKIKAEVEKQLGHPLNHALIQFYRDGTDYISEHSDKTLDIVKGSYIANVSLGAERTMVFRTKRRDKDPSGTEAPSGEDSKQRKTTREKLPHNSLCRMGLETNMRWLHAIRQDKRAEREKTAPELAFSGGRISLTFRRIGTFLDREGTSIWGQGATGKTRDEAQPVINGQGPEAVGMLRAFGTENHSTDFDWDKHYGKGFNVLHISNSPRLCASADPVVNMRIALMLAEFGVAYAKGSMSPSFKWKDGSPDAKNAPAVPETLPIRFVDNDAAKSTVQGELAIMLYLDSVHGPEKAGAPAGRSQPDTARVFTRFQQGLALLDKWRPLERDGEGKRVLKPLARELALWDGYAAEADSIAGSAVSLADFAVWPVLHAIVEESGIEALAANEKLKEYYDKVKARESTAKVLGVDHPDGADSA